MDPSCLKDIVINCTDRDFTKIECTFEEASAVLPVSACRLQVGSYSCGNYFFALLQKMEQGELDILGKSYDLVFPVFSESQLARFETLAACLSVKNACHIVVNDYGMLQRFGNDRRVRLGRLLFPDYRDHRYPEYEDRHNGQAKSEALVSALRGLGFSVYAIENDMTIQDGIADLSDIAVYYHFPYRQVSVSHICEFASIGKPILEKFIPDDVCAFQCFQTKVRAAGSADRTQYQKIGRNVFDLLDKEWLATERIKYMIYTPRW